MNDQPSSSFHSPPADARTASSLLLLRDGPAGVEVLMLVRAERADGDPRSGVAVFPGGVLDAADREAHAWCLDGTSSPPQAADAAWSRRLRLPSGGLDFVVAVLRETFEEVGLLLACRPDGSVPDLAPGSALAVALAPWRDRLQNGQANMAALCAHFDLRLDLRGLAYAAHWLTPPGSPKRWDTRFFCAMAPQAQLASPDLGEAVEVLWTTPAAALDPARGLKLLPVSRRLLADLGRQPDAASAHAAFAAQREVPLVMPRAARHGQRGRVVVLPDELPYAEVARLDPDGRGHVSAELVPGRPVRLSAHVWRVTAGNPGPMTGPGTNSYLVGAGRAWTVIDPGPADPAHLQALQAAAHAAGLADAPASGSAGDAAGSGAGEGAGAGAGAGAEGGRIVRVLVTHTHRDHSPGAAPLAAASGAAVWGRVADHSEWQDASFAPQHQPAHGERIVLAPGVVLRVLHTPGHASNHLCYLLEHEQLLFTGDHVMQGSTVVINPPDGDMAAYLQSLQALLDEPLQWLAPGHGFLVDQPHAVLRRLIAHRLQREAKVLAAVQAAGGGTLQDLLPRVYDDVRPALHGVAARSLLAHLRKLHAEGRVQQRGEGEAAHWAPPGEGAGEA